MVKVFEAVETAIVCGAETWVNVKLPVIGTEVPFTRTKLMV